MSRKDFAITLLLVLVITASVSYVLWRGGILDHPNVFTHPNYIPVSANEVIELLEHGDISQVSTAHNQNILIRTKDGKKYMCNYNYREANKYRDVDDVGNLALQIVRDKRLGDIIVME